jgi:hypothetical protein
MLEAIWGDIILHCVESTSNVSMMTGIFPCQKANEFARI